MERNRWPGDKVHSRASLLEAFGKPREGRLVFTNGCFDILHRGHVEYLRQARDLGDALVVGVNTDESVARLKGKGRPVVPQDDRVWVLAGLESVDAVTLFHEDTPRAIISELLPDVLVKGGDYDLDQVVGRAEVEAAGGVVTLIPFLTGRSTSDLLTRIRGDAS
ncbi:MAG: D-glycero-beta-D-manno-heptose 1-phosphate adenylyltransferase [Gemmatimonadetes bacterium]|nr:D-glycero-beta-D-manno-heptose 1-phosphate adenylyltransferase [Gemmatimonadota bacterium]NNM05011.1 D-glycero-beta-D-manno-heptose 1-phosphate adenylyltransferase [Gemmatimonadota bacterium]